MRSNYTTIYHEVVPIEPVAKGRPRFDSRSGRTYTPAKTRVAEAQLSKALWYTRKFREPSKEPLSISVCFAMRKPKTNKHAHPSQKPDCDNLLKLLGDAANGILWVDDSQIIEVTAIKRWARSNEQPSITLRVDEIKNAPGLSS